MPPKRRHSHKSTIPEEDSPAAAKRARAGPTRQAPKRGGGTDSGSATTSVLSPAGRAQEPKVSAELSTSHEQVSAKDHRSPHHVCSSHAIAILADSIDLDDYKTQLYYFWGHIFLLVRNLKTTERQEIFQATLPEFAQGGSGDIRGKLETEFDMCYRQFQKHFIKVVEVYGQRWLKSSACQKYLEIELHARYFYPPNFL